VILSPEWGEKKKKQHNIVGKGGGSHIKTNKQKMSFIWKSEVFRGRTRGNDGEESKCRRAGQKWYSHQRSCPGPEVSDVQQKKIIASGKSQE